MSFGGGRDQYTLEYVIKVVNQGGASGLNQVNTGLHQVDDSVKQVTASQEKLAQAANRVSQANIAVNKAAKGMAFGMFGMITAGAELGGMLSMWKQVQEAQTEATEEQSRALKEAGKDSKEYKDATMEVAKVNRWAGMTFRNLMLSMFDMMPFTIMAINGFMNLKKALEMRREAKAAQDALLGLGVSSKTLASQTLATNAAMASSGLTFSKYSKGVVLAQSASFKFGAETVKTQATMAGLNAGILGANGAMAKSVEQTGKLTKAMRVLSIAMKIAIPLIALEVGSQAYERNWGGFADKINAVGVEIGKTIPQLKGFLDLVKKVGESVVAIFTGNWDRIGHIWNPVTKGAEGAITLSEKAQKELDEARQKVEEFRDSANDLFKDIAQGNRQNQREKLKLLGITTGKTQFDDAKKGAKDFFDQLEESYKQLDEVQARFAAMEKINILENLGLEVDPDVVKKMRYATESSLRDIIPGEDIFDKLADVVEKNASASQGDYNQAIAQFVADNPGIVQAFKDMGYPDIAEYLGGLKTSLQTQVKNAFTSNEVEGVDAGELGLLGPGYEGGPGIFGPIIDKLKEGVKGLPAQIKAIDWSAVGLALRDSFLSIVTFFKLDDPQYLGNILRANVIDPIFVAFGTALKEPIEQFKKDPVGFTIGAINMGTEWLGNFVAGVFNYNSEDEMFNDWENKLVIIFRNNKGLTALRTFLANPIGYVLDVLRGNIGGGTVEGGFNEAEGKTFPERGQSPLFERVRIGIDVIINALGFTQIVTDLETAYNQFVTWFNNNEIVQTLKQFIGNPLGVVFTLIQNAVTSTQTVKEEPVVATLSSDDILNKIGFTQFKTDLQTAYDAIVKWKDESLILKGMQILYNAIASADPKAIIDAIMNFGKPQTVEGAGLTTDTGGIKITIAGIDVTGLETSATEGAGKVYQTFITMVDNIAGLMNMLGSHWSMHMNKTGENAQSGADQIRDALGPALQDVHDTMQDLSNRWSGFCADMANNAADTKKAFRDEFGTALQDVYDTMEDLAKQWSRFCNSMGANARSAAKQINKALDSIEDEEVVITYVYKTEGTPKAKGGIMSFANGGPMSAAGGKLLTTYGPQLFQIGDNPGGRESIWAIPHDNPGPTVSKIEKMYKGSSNGSSSSIYNQTINLNIKGSDIIDDTKITRKIRTTMGSNMDRFG